MKTLTLPELPTPVAGRVPEFSFGDRLHKARATAGLTAEELAGVLGIHRQTIGRYETDAATPSKAVTVMWGYVTNVDLIWLFTGECTPRDSNSEPTGFESKTVVRHAQTSARNVRVDLQETDAKPRRLESTRRTANIRRDSAKAVVK